MECLIKICEGSMMDIIKWTENYKRELHKQLKEYFRNSGIRQNFLIEILCAIKKTYMVNFFNWFDVPFTNEKMVTMDYGNPEYIICKHIVGVYKSFTLFKSIKERKELERSQVFRSKLIKEVVFRLNLNIYSKDLFRKKQLFGGDSFIYFSIPYYIFTMCGYILIRLDKNSIYLRMRLSLLQSAFAILDLMENNIIDKAYPIGRGLIETYIKYLCLMGKPEAVKMRDILMLEEINHNVCGEEFTKEFETLFNAKKGLARNKLDFLHYGFVDKIKNYYDIIDKDESPYSVTAMFEYLKKTVAWVKKEEIDDLENYYHMCHAYVHDNCSNSYPLNGYLELSKILYIIIIDIFKNVCNELKIDYAIDGLDIMEHVKLAYDQLEEQIKNRNTELFEEYYKAQ